MAATHAQRSTREIFTTLEYGPVPESHACALVRACRSRSLEPWSKWKKMRSEPGARCENG
uniref:Uncharacterized protein n=1 Tax=Lynx canadensis TaxID=61383 RepID=A0A667J039_LYNCA